MWPNILRVVTPRVAALCAPIELRGGFVCRPCLQHPPECQIILTMWALDAGSRKRVDSLPLHYLKRNVRPCLSALMLLVLFFLTLFCLKSALWTYHYFFARCGPKACLALWTETQCGKT